MGYSPWGRKESDRTGRLALSLSLQIQGIVLYGLESTVSLCPGYMGLSRDI